MSNFRKQLETQGFAIIDRLFDARRSAAMRAELEAYWRSVGSPPFDGWGFGIHPLVPKFPEMGKELVHPAIMKALREIFDEEAVCVHGGARMANERSSAAIDWHNHYSWDTANLASRTRCERVLCGLYLSGSNVEAGPLTAVARSLNEPIGEIPGLNDPREIMVEAAPGSVVIFDTALWHRAKTGTRPGIRSGFGGHYQPVSETRSHPEDNDVGNLAGVHARSGVA
jgi:hypothetical protein